MSERMRITPQELSDPRIDRELAAQAGFGAGSAPTTEPQPLFFKPWFALGLAGLVGAVFAWALIEPRFDDGVRFVAPVTEIEERPELNSSGLQGLILEAGGVRIVVPKDAVVADENGGTLSLSSILRHDPIEVLGRPVPVEKAQKRVLIATLIRVRPRGVQMTEEVNVASLESRNNAVGLFFFPIAAALIGVFVGAADGLLSRAWTRAARSAGISLAACFVAGMVALIPAGFVFNITKNLIESGSETVSAHLSGRSLLIAMMGRGLTWAIVGIAAGIGQGVAMRSKKLLMNGMIGGAIGSLAGGLLFDPISVAVAAIHRSGGAEVSRLLGLSLIGLSAGAMIGVVELVAREAWIRLLTGPIAGKEFILYRDPTWIGSSPKCEVFLFRDAQVIARHAAIHRVGEHYELEDQGSPAGTWVDGSRQKRRRLRDRDRVQVGATTMEFRLRDE